MTNYSTIILQKLYTFLSKKITFKLFPSFCRGMGVWFSLKQCGRTTHIPPTSIFTNILFSVLWKLYITRITILYAFFYELETRHGQESIEIYRTKGVPYLISYGCIEKYLTVYIQQLITCSQMKSLCLTWTVCVLCQKQEETNKNKKNQFRVYNKIKHITHCLTTRQKTISYD